MNDHGLMHLWSDLKRFEDHLSGGGHGMPPTFDSFGRSFDSLAGSTAGLHQTSRVQRVRDALYLSGYKAKSMIGQSLAGIDLSTIWDILIEAAKDMALCYGAAVVGGGAIGGVAGAFAGGIGAAPGATAGAAAGATVGGWILAWMGLKALAEGLIENIPAALEFYKRGFIEAWGPTRPGWPGYNAYDTSYRDNTDSAAWQMANGHVLLIMALLSVMAAYLTRGRGDKALMMRDVRQSSRLGPKVANWLEENEEKLRNHPNLKPRERQGAGNAGEEILPPPVTRAQPSPKKSAQRKSEKLVPGSAEHKADRWNRYQKKGGEKSYDRWSKQYDTNMRNYQFGGAREAEYRAAMDASEGTLKTPYTNRQIDILKEDELYAGQLKTGPVSLTKENALAIKKDGQLVEEGWTVEHILEKGGSKPYLDALDRAGIQYKIGPQIP